jgi:predicted O-methyltransferase YrrM
MQELIDRIYAEEKVYSPDGKEVRLHSCITPDEGELLSDLIRKDETVKKTLEVGFAQGMSALYICQAIDGRPGATHTALDPFQREGWQSVGLANIERSGFKGFRLIEERSEFALPSLCKEAEGTFDLILVDGWHTFDHTLVDCFFATRLLRVGGYLVIDDISMRPVHRCLEYLLTYPCYELIASSGFPKGQSVGRLVAKTLRGVFPRSLARKVLSPRLYERIYVDSVTNMAALKKVRPDDRTWDWFVEF